MPRMVFRSAALAAVLLLGGQPARSVSAQETPELAPYIMLRSLQFVQDTVALGDHSAGEMQRFMLNKIDSALRAADTSTFDDPRNVDAALIYAMSGGNPATLEYLVERDLSGNFDSRVADALRKYLGGKGTLVAKSLGDMAMEYRDQAIGPYVALVSGNVTDPENPVGALEYYDIARLGAPGTIIEEAALRRSVAIAVDADLVDKGLAYSRKYARRFVHSPYASQFVDFFVQLVVEHHPELSEPDIDATVEFMDVERRREVFLRIARRATLDGKNDLARMASGKAAALAGMAADGPEVLARLYRGVASIPTSEVGTAIEDLAAIPADELSPRDQALRAAAQAIASEVIRKPTTESLAQDAGVKVEARPDAEIEEASPGYEDPGPAVVALPASLESSVEIDPEIQTFVESGRSKLSEIDDLLKQEGVVR
ncbi:Chemotaxis protein MotC precursor [Pseudorhizobium banfieldiae]|uniref:Chemotaxis protein MotC n=1 Tax=Pseudorhizobium banfieldiae TaxID=1125847 RepID=L0NCA0_9HYPH|nr:chemotaxis protein [arsenite-oxidising bacterium NT-25]CCF17957.1 Chemotaxis protein MotC precursor [Pseudorhizobium banfieldiae]